MKENLSLEWQCDSMRVIFVIFGTSCSILAFHIITTIGSAFAVKADAYVRVGEWADSRVGGFLFSAKDFCTGRNKGA